MGDRGISEGQARSDRRIGALCTASRRNSSGYLDGRPIRDSFLRPHDQNQVSTEPGQLQPDFGRKIAEGAPSGVLSALAVVSAYLGAPMVADPVTTAGRGDRQF
jgi:hypothetical protein